MLYLTFQEPSKLVDKGSIFQTWIPHVIVVTGGQNSPSVHAEEGAGTNNLVVKPWIIRIYELV